MTDTLFIASGVEIPVSELTYKTSRSGGKGGQNVNKVETKVELLFDVAASPSLPPEVKAMLMKKLGSRIDTEGVMHVASQVHRSQLQNKEEATERFQDLLQAALKPEKPRRATKPTRSSKEKRLTGKREKSQKKTNRRSISDSD